MREPISANHLSDQTLISYLDGELGLKDRLKVKRHLFGCWQCRTRLNQFEKQVRQLVTAYHSEVYPSPTRVDNARRKFFTEFERMSSQFPPQPVEAANHRIGFSVLFPAAAAAGALAVIVSLSFWIARRAPASLSQETLAAAARFDETLVSSPDVVRQAYLVEFVQRKPAPERHSGRLEIWSHGPEKRFTSRWDTSDGTLQHAVWRPSADEALVYRASGTVEKLKRATHSFPLLQIVERGGDTRALERAFLEWVESREWRPVSLTADLGVYASQEGAIFQAEPIATRGGEERIRLVLRRTLRDATVEVVVEVDARTYEPRMRRMRYESPNRSVELVFVASAAEYVSAELVEASLFRPSPSLLQPAPRRANARQLTEQSPAALPLKPDATAIANAEIEILFALHSLGVCRGEQISVVASDDSLAITGIVTGDERKQQVVAALGSALRGDWITFEIRTIGEALQSDTPAAVTYSTALTERVENRLPIQDELEAYFRRHPLPDKASPRDSVTQFASALNANWNLVRSEAFALQALAQRYASPARRDLLTQREPLGA